MLGIAREDWEKIKVALAKRKSDLIILAAENERLQKEIEGLCLQRLDDLVSSYPYPEQHSQQITDLRDYVKTLKEASSSLYHKIKAMMFIQAQVTTPDLNPDYILDYIYVQSPDLHYAMKDVHDLLEAE